MKKNILLVVNPISGDIDKTDLIDIVAQFTAIKNRNFILYETQGAGDILNIKKLYHELDPERIIIAGGDGTIKMVGEALEHDDVIFGILPAGSANGLATDLGLPASIEDCLDVIFKDKFMEIDMVEINGKKSLHLSDIGLNAELIKNYENGTIRGKLGYAIQAISTFMDREEPFRALIEVNQMRIECEVRMIVMANSQKYGTGVVINPTGVIDDGKFELIILKNLDLFVLGQIIAGTAIVEPENIEIISTDYAKITTSRPVNFQIDGEYCGTETVLNIRISPSKMKITIS